MTQPTDIPSQPRRFNDAASSRHAPEKVRVTLGIVPLTDCAPIVIAQEKGFFEREGIDVLISREASWATIRDKVTFGILDGAQMLAPMPIAATLGASGFEKPMITAMSLGLNGNAITVSNELYARMAEADPAAMLHRPVSAAGLGKVIARGGEPLTFATVFPFSSHHYQLRYWMAAAGINPDRDLRLIIIPPSQMVQTLQEGAIDGYCVGEPWNELAVRLGAGRRLISCYDIWNNAPEKVLGVTRDWAMKYPGTHSAMLRALLRAGQWLDEPGNRAEAVAIITQPQYVSVPPEVMTSMAGVPGAGLLPAHNVFFRYAATFPWRSHAVWYITQMMRWGQLDEAVNVREVAQQVYRPDLYRAAAAQLGLAFPTCDDKTEGLHAGAWTLNDATQPMTMGPDRFCDLRPFDPAQPLDYLNRADVGSVVINPASLAAANA
jgi:nitrate/nitrite transport system substrate-binding protein